MASADLIHTYLVTLAGVMMAQATPGPNFAAVASAALGQGRRAGLFTVLGVATGMLVWTLAVAFGLAVVVKLYPAFLTALKILGGGYLLFLALRAARAAFAGAAVSVRADTRAVSGFANFSRGLLVILTNPKAALMWIAVATFLFGSGLSTPAVLAFGPMAFVTASLIYGTYAILFSTGLALRAYRRFARLIEGLFATAFGALGGRLLADGLKELRT